MKEYFYYEILMEKTIGEKLSTKRHKDGRIHMTGLRIVFRVGFSVGQFHCEGFA